MITEEDIRQVLVRFDAVDVDELTELITEEDQRAPKHLADEFDATFGDGGRPA